MTKPFKKILISLKVGFAVMVIVVWGGIILPDLIPYRGPSWRGVTIGVSSKEEVLKTLGPSRQIISDWITTQLIYEEKLIVKGTHIVVLRFGVVQEIEEDTIIGPNTLYLSSLVDRYGRPNTVEWSLEDPSLRTVVFASQGILADVVGAPLDQAYVTRIIYFKPMPLLWVRIRFSEIFSSIDPAPNADVVGPKDPWFGTSKACRYKCK